MTTPQMSTFELQAAAILVDIRAQQGLHIPSAAPPLVFATQAPSYATELHMVMPHSPQTMYSVGRSVVPPTTRARTACPSTLKYVGVQYLRTALTYPNGDPIPVMVYSLKDRTMQRKSRSAFSKVVPVGAFYACPFGPCLKPAQNCRRTQNHVLTQHEQYGARSDIEDGGDDGT